MNKNNEYISLSELMNVIGSLPKTMKTELSTSLDNKDDKYGYWIRKEDDGDWWLECSRCGYEPQNNHIPTAFCCNCGAEMGDYNGLVRSCETCNHYNANTCWCSRYNDTTYSSNCSSYQVKE